MSSIGFSQPLWLWALTLLPVLLAIAFRAEQKRARDVARLLATRLAPQLTAGASPALRWSRTTLFLLALAAGIVTLARPHAGYTLRETRTTGRDVILAIDVSRSMLANDLQPSRLVRAQLLADDIIRQLPGDRVGIVAFAGSAFLQAPLTVDHGAVLESVQALNSDIIPHGGSNIAQAIRTALDAFGKGESSHRALVILSDGEELDADAIPVTQEAADLGVRFFTVGIGTPNGSVIPVPDNRGGTEFVKDATGNLVTSRLDEQRLREIAAIGGGSYHNLAANPGSGQNIASAIREIAARESGSEITREPLERFQWPLGFAVATLLAALMLPERTRSKRHTSNLARSASLLLITTTLTAPTSSWAANRAAQAFSAGDFDKAYENFAARATSSGSPQDAYNAGTAALKANRLDEAITQLGKALTSKDPSLQARADYNLASALAAKAANQQDPSSSIPLIEDAITHFLSAENDPALADDATFNRKAASEWLEELKKLQLQQNQEKQQQDKQSNQQDQQQKDQQQQQQGESQEQQQQDQQQGDNSNDPQQEGSQDQQQKDNTAATESKQQQQQHNGDGSQQHSDTQPTPEPTPVPGQNEETLEGEMQQKTPDEQEQKNQHSDTQESATAEPAEAPDGEMTPAQARAILESLRGDERRVLLFDRQQQQQLPTNKDW